MLDVGPGCRCNYTECSSCVDTINKCLSCNKTSKSLFNFTCLSTCPTTYYSENRTCIKCGTSCSICVNSTICTTCSSGYLYLGKC